MSTVKFLEYDNELITIEGGGFWRTVGQIVGVLAVAAIIYYAPAVIAFL